MAEMRMTYPIRYRPRRKPDAKVPLPENYEAAKVALRRCAKHFTPERFAVAMAALETVLEHDECEAITSGAVRVATYCKIANDNELERLAYRVTLQHRKWRAAQAATE